jgi:hypothetical protein
MTGCVNEERLKINDKYTLSAIVSVQIRFLKSTEVTAFPRARELPIKDASITIDELENNGTNLALESCLFMWRGISEALLTTLPQMIHGSTVFCNMTISKYN